MADSLHIQRLEKALEIGPFIKYAKEKLAKLNDIHSSSDQDSDSDRRHTFYNKELIFNPQNITEERKWLHDLMLSESDDESEISDEDAYVKEMLKDHVRDKKFRQKYHQKPTNAQYGYYSVGMLSNNDVYSEHRESVLKPKKKRLVGRPPKSDVSNKRPVGRPSLISKIKVEKEDSNDYSNDFNDIDWEDQISMSIKDEEPDSRPHSPRGRKRRALGAQSIKALLHRRRKVWMSLKKEVGKFQRMKANNHKEMLVSCKKTAAICQKVARQKAMESQKRQKETIWRAKKLTREMLSYWKKFDRVERENRRRQEKEAEEQRKMDVELIEVKRQQRKLNFLITQTELYAHFMSHKGELSSQEEQKILSQLDENNLPKSSSAIDNYDSELMKSQAQKNVQDAFLADLNRTKEFDKLAHAPTLHAQIDNSGNIVELPQPDCFKGVLKGYQLKGMTWLAHLYEQGISGILADEMGLGKTVQSIAFLCHVAENYGVYGPFLIISPASTLHNWQQEMQRFVPGFKVIPYWGSPNQRKVLRQFWNQTNVHTKEASFHVVITSYQLVVSDYKYFNRVKWMYMILDEAQAIKSTSSVRWKLLLGFNCRNRLLLSGTPIQNSMAELWALLHFIMPTLFDSHDEFNEWFSKDIESHAENKTGIDEKQITRLHMILKPFMLRRIKKDVENELSDKIEIMMYCPLTTRQKYLYMALKKKIRIEDLLKATGHMDGHTTDKNFTSNLMNLVMQFRKVCNHPELFERRDIKSPFSLLQLEYVMPRLIFNECRLYKMIPSKQHLLYNKFSIFKAENIHRRMLPETSECDGISFLRFINLSCGDVEKLTLHGLLEFLLNCKEYEKNLQRLSYQNEFSNHVDKRFLLIQPTFSNKLNKTFMHETSVLQQLIFTSHNSRESSIYTHQDQFMCSMQETTEHRIIRSRHAPIQIKSPTRILKSPMKSPTNIDKNVVNDFKFITEFPHIPREPKKLICEPTEMPKFLYSLPLKVHSVAKRLYCESRAAAWEEKRMNHCDSSVGWQMINEAVNKMHPHSGWSMISIPDKQALVSDAGKLYVLDLLLTRLKSEGHRVLIYSQMTKMIDLLEEYMWHRKHRYMRLDGSSKISARRDMVADFQSREDIFCFLLSTRAGGLGINLTAADTVIFYDSDWNPTVDQQAMDRAHRLGQTKQVTVYRLICKGTIEERILQRAREKSEIQRMVISGGNFKPDTLKPKEVVSLLLDDDEIEKKYHQTKKVDEASPAIYDIPTKKRKNFILSKETKKQKLDVLLDAEDLAFLGSSNVPSPSLSDQSLNESGKRIKGSLLDESSNDALGLDLEKSLGSIYGDLKPKKRNPQRAGNRRPGRPRGTGKKRDELQSDEPPKPKRGPGRPKSSTKAPGPMNKGFRNIPSLKKSLFIKPPTSSSTISSSDKLKINSPITKPPIIPESNLI